MSRFFICKMRRHIFRWSHLSVVFFILSLSVSADDQQSDVTPSAPEQRIDTVESTTSDHHLIEENLLEDVNSLTDNLMSDRYKRVMSSGYETRMEPRLFFPVLAAPRRPRPTYGLPSKGYGPPKAPPIGYPGPRPPPQQRPQPVYRPTQPPHTYGPPKKPTGYPASSNHHNVDEIYITHAPATYPSGSNYGGLTSTSKPNYQVPISFPNPNYETPTYPASYPVVPSRPDYVTPATPNPLYPSSTPCYHAHNNPIYPTPPPVSQPQYPTYPAKPPNNGGSYPLPPPISYPPAQPAPYKPVPAYPSPVVQPVYPSSGSGSSYGTTGSSPPIFVFIPKPGYFNAATNNYKPTYPKPSGTYPAPVHHYPPARPSPVPYPAPYPKPSGGYPAAKPPSTAYGAPKAPKPVQQPYPNPQPQYAPVSYPVANEIPRPIHSAGQHQSGTGYRNDKAVSTPYDYKTSQPNIQQQTHSHQLLPQPSQTNELVRFPSSQPSTFQRGNNRPGDSLAVHSDLYHDFVPVTGLTSLGQVGSLPLANANQSWPTGEGSNQIATIAQLASSSDLTLFRDDFRAALQDRPKKNDCGGSWVVLEQPVGGFVDPTQVQVESILPGFPGAFNNGDFNQLVNGQLFRSPDGQGVSLVSFPPNFPSDQTLSGQSINAAFQRKPSFPDLLIFSTTPNSIDPLDNNDDDSVEEELWKKPSKLSSSSAFVPSRLVGVKDVTSTSGDLSQLLTKEIRVNNPGITKSIQTLSSTENSIILSLNGINNLRANENGLELQSVERSPSPFLVDVGGSQISGDDDSSEATTISTSSTDDDPAAAFRTNTNSTSSNDAEKLIGLLRSANLRTLSSLIDQAGIAILFQDKEFTLIAPSNLAFRALTARQRKRWDNRPELLREMLLYHVIAGHLNSSSLVNEATPLTMAGSRRLRVNIYNATEKTDSVTTFNGARVLTADLRIGNLLVHVVDRVIVPSSNPSQTILDILNDGGLQASLLGPALTRVLSSDAMPLTVFVPTTEAFLSVSQDERNLFLNNETAFHNLLWYHMVQGTYYSEGLEDGQLLTTLHKDGRLRVGVTRQNRKKKLERINGEANVIESDVSATNGVVHFIDRILTDILF